MSDQVIDSLREQMFTYIDQADQDICAAVDALAVKLDAFPSFAMMAHDQHHYLVLLLQRLEALSVGSDPRLIEFHETMTRLDNTIHARIYLADPKWGEE